jgi:thymidylate synthase
MYLGIATERSCARAWVAAAAKLIENGDEAYNVVIDVEDPLNHDDRDNAIITHVDNFLRAHDQYPVSSVAETIFPQSLYLGYGAPTFYELYLRDFASFSAQIKRWGRYFQRMVTERIDRKGRKYRLLDKIVHKLQRQNSARSPFRAAYELPLYDPDLDRNRFRDAPCLSYLSFKRHPDKALLLTAVYRNHTYITRCLGNLIGLGRLQAFVAKQAGLKLGSLTCISTHAELDTGEHWGIKDARELVEQAARVLEEWNKALPALR